MATYCTPQDIIDRFTESVVLRLTNTGNSELGAEDTARIQDAVDEAQAEVDSYVMMRHTLPLPSVPASLKSATVDLAVYRLVLRRGYDQEADSEFRLARNDAIDWLKQLAAGRASLGVQSPAKDMGAEIDSADRVFSRDGMKVF